jgi:hypothetical protein
VVDVRACARNPPIVQNDDDLLVLDLFEVLAE